MEYDYDANGNRTEKRVTDQSGTLAQSIAYAYDLRDRVVQVDAGGSITQYGLYRNQLAGQVTEGRGYTTRRTYDGHGRLTTVAPPAGDAATYQYDAQDRIIRVALNNGNGPVTTYAYDDLGNLVQESSPDRGTITYRYDAAGNRIGQTDARGVTVSYTYDALNRVVEARYSDGSTVAYAYDTAPNGVGRLAGVTDPSGSTRFAYDGIGQLVEKRQSVWNGSGYLTLQTQYQYDEAGRPSAVVYPSGLTVDYRYDVAGRPAQLAINGVPWLSGIRYQPFGAVSEWQWADGSVHVRGYDLGGRLTDFSLGRDWRWLEYDAADNLLRLHDSVTDRAFEYDPVNRLVGASGGAESPLAWQYDGNGNRLTEQWGRLTDTYRYGAGSNRLLEIGGARQRLYAYDLAGNVVGDGVHRYTYDVRGRLAAVDEGATATYLYDGFGQRVAKFTGSAPVPTVGADLNDDGAVTEADLHVLQALIRAGEYRAFADLTGDGRDLACVAMRIGDSKNRGKGAKAQGAPGCGGAPAAPGVYFAYDEAGRLLGEYTGAGAPRQETAWFEGRPVTTVRGDGFYAVHADHLGAPRVVTGPAGELVWRWPDAPFGTAPAEEDPDGDGVQFAYNLRFRGQYFDAETGLHYNYHRYYDPRLGRYVTSDPIGLAGGLNTCTYVSNNPLNFIDPLAESCATGSSPSACRNQLHRQLPAGPARVDTPSR